MLGNNLQQTTPADDIFRCIFFLGTLRVKTNLCINEKLEHFQLQVFKVSQSMSTKSSIGRPPSLSLGYLSFIKS